MNALPHYLHVQPARVPLCQYEILLLAHPVLQSGVRRVKEVPDRAAQGFVTADVYGRIGRSDLDGRRIVEEMRVEVNGEDVYNLLPATILGEIERYVLDN